MTSSDDTSSEGKDPAAVLRAAIAAAQKPPVTKPESTAESAESSHISGNVHAHPSLTRQTRAKARQDYFIKDEPLVRRCDPAFGAGFEFD